PTVEKDRFSGVEEALQKLAHQAASDTPEVRPAAPAPDLSADARMSQSPAAATLGPADVSAQIPRESPSRGKRNLARLAIVVCLGAWAIWAWGSYGGVASNMIATGMMASSAPPSSAGATTEQMPAAQTAAPAAAQAAALPAAAPPAPPPAQAAPMPQPATTA